MAAKVIDRDQAPDYRDQRATGIPRRLQYGHPTVGGFGALPLREHVQARWACWAWRFTVGATQPLEGQAPWIRVLDLLLERVHPAFQPLALLTATPDGPWAQASRLPAEVSRLFVALSSLPPIVDNPEDPLPGGGWCWNMPLWGNPLLPDRSCISTRPGLELRLSLIHI